MLVPFRKAEGELQQFAPAITAFLTKQGVKHDIFIINQIDDYRFNRGQLINIGFLTAAKAGADYVAMHDVDLIPLNDDLSYAYPDDPMHIAAPWLHPKYASP